MPDVVFALLIAFVICVWIFIAVQNANRFVQRMRAYLETPARDEERDAKIFETLKEAQRDFENHPDVR